MAVQPCMEWIPIKLIKKKQKTNFVSFDRSNNRGAIDVAMDIIISNSISIAKTVAKACTKNLIYTFILRTLFLRLCFISINQSYHCYS